jgi:uncharacterized protein involved in outer membrane biogenesis
MVVRDPPGKYSSMDIARLNLRDRRTRWLAIALFVMVLVAALVATFDPNWLKGPIERRVEAVTGRSLHLRGDLHARLGRVIEISASDVDFGNAEWAQSPAMAHAGRIALGIAAWPLLRGELRLTQIELDHPEIHLERNARGDANWRLRKRSALSHRPVRFDSLVIRNGALTLRDPQLDTDLRLEIATGARGRDDAYAPLHARGTGRYRHGEFRLEGRADSPLQLLQRGGGYRLDVKASAGATHAHVRGTLPAPIDLVHFELRTDVSGQDLADLYTLLDFAVPESPPYALTGRLERNGSIIAYRDFSGRIGDTDMAGDLTVDIGRETPFARGKLVSRHLDLDDLAVLVGAPPATGAGETANAQQREDAAERARGTRLLPDRPFNLTKLRSLDADITLEAGEVESRKLPIDAIAARVQLDDGVLEIHPLDVGVAGGTVEGSVSLDARRNVMRTGADLAARNVDLPRLFPRLKQTSIGRIAGTAKLTGRGNSLAHMFATADGEIATGMGHGRMSNLLLELAGLDVAESIKFLLGRDKSVDVRCAYADFAVDDGVMHSRALAVDTSDTVITGDGTMDLRQERLDLTLRPRPRDISPIALRVPLEVGGTFKDPSFHPKVGPLATRVAIAGALYAIAPPAALLALIETGPGGKVQCGPQSASAKPADGRKHDGPDAETGHEEANDATSDGARPAAAPATQKPPKSVT